MKPPQARHRRFLAPGIEGSPPIAGKEGTELCNIAAAPPDDEQLCGRSHFGTTENRRVHEPPAASA
jgi:hypothetical protein